MKAANRAIIAALVAWRLAVELLAERPSSPDEHSLVLGLGQRRRRGPPGSYPNEPPRSHGGKYGLRERYELPLTSVGNPRDYLVNRWGTPAFCWVAGDGNTPTVGPALTATGTPGSIAGPWELEDGTRLPLETYTGAECRRNTTPLDPAAGEDAVVVVIGRMPSNASAGQMLFSTRPAGGRGIEIIINGNNQLNARAFTAGGNGYSLPAAGHVAPGGLFVAVLTYDRIADTVTLWTPGASGAATAVSDGAIVGGGLGLACDPEGNNKLGAGGAILAAAYYVGAGKAAEWTSARRLELQALATGLEPRGNQAASKGRPTATRASAASWQDDDGRWWIVSRGLMRAGDPKGWRRSAGRTNEVYNNVNPSVTTGWSVTGGGTTPATLTAVSDAAALATYKGECWGPNVFKLDNSAGDASAYAYGGAATGNANARSYQAIARQTGAGGGQVGSRDASAGTFTSHVAVGTDAYSRVIAVNKTPADTDEQFCVHAPAGTVVYFVAAQRETGAVATTPIPNWATGTPAARAAEVITPPVSPRDSRGRVSLGYTPMGWSGFTPEGGSAGDYMVSRATVIGYPLYVASNGRFRSYDGTTVCEVVGPAPVDGVRSVLSSEWSGQTQRVTADGTAASAAYDGAQGGSGTYQLQATIAEAAIDSVVIEEAA